MSKKFKIPEDTVVEIFPEGYMPYEKVPGSTTTAKKLTGTIAGYKCIQKSYEKYKNGQINEKEYQSEVERCRRQIGSFVTTADHDGKSTSIWYAEIICFLKLSLPHDGFSDQVRELEVAFVKWHKEVKKADRHELLGLPVLKVEKTQRKVADDASDKENKYQMEPFTDLRLTGKLLRPVFLQKDLGTTTSTFVHNTYVN